MKEFIRYFAATFCLQFVAITLLAFLFEVTRSSLPDLVLFGLYVSPVEGLTYLYKEGQPEMSPAAVITISFIPPAIYSFFAAAALKRLRSH